MPTVRWDEVAATWDGEPIGWDGVDPPPPPDGASLTLGADTLSLDDHLGAGIICTSIDLGWPTVRVVTANRAGVDGAMDTTELFGPRAVTVNLAVVDHDAGTWKAALARLSRFLAARSRPTLDLVFDGVAYTMTLAPDVAAAPFEFPSHARVQLAFRAPDPFLYTNGNEAVSAASKPSTVGRVYPWTPPRIYPISDEITGLFTVTNAGVVTAWPTVEILGPSTAALFLDNLTTGDRFALTSTTIEDGHSLVIDMLARTVLYDGDPTLPRFSLVDFATSTWLGLEPGDNVLRFSSDVASSALATVRWSDPHLWPGGLTL